jgi:hypothetical protein
VWLPRKIVSYVDKDDDDDEEMVWMLHHVRTILVVVFVVVSIFAIAPLSTALWLSLFLTFFFCG